MNIMNTSERKPVVVIYDDENVLECLQQELCNAMFAAANAGQLKSRINEDGDVIYQDKDYRFTLSIYDEFAVVHTRENFYLDDDIEQLRLKAQIEQKERELAELKGKLK